MSRGIIALMLAAAGAWAVLASDGLGQQNPFSRLTGREQPVEASAVWYERADRRGRLVLDRSSVPALLWQEGSAEVLAVYANRASGGGEVLLTDTDRAILRLSNLGGATFFPPDAPDGVIVELIGPAHTLVAPPVSASELQRAARDLADAATRINRNQVMVEVPSLGPSDNAYLADTLRLAQLGIDRANRRALRDLQSIRVQTGARPDAVYSGGTLEITIAAGRGYAGRPSSEFIRRALDRGR
ncbi:MAG TPA: hypothetical protein DF715_08565 [Oceanicaulis sp.]|nr:hypothetical protein [Oceanicaulis sp.]